MGTNPLPTPEAPKPQTDWKKVIAMTMAGIVTPTVGNWANSYMQGNPQPFTVGNVLIPAIPVVAATLMALFSQPNKK